MLRITSACPKTRHAFARLALAVGAAALMAACSTAAADDDASVADPRGTRAAAAFSRVIIPSGTTLHLTLHTAVASDTSQVEDAVAAELTHPLTIDGRTALPVGALVGGVVSGVDRSGRVKGRARLALDFTSVTSGGRRYPMTAEPYSRVASATKGEDATKIGIGAGAGAVIGGILGGKKGSVEGAAIGGGAGTGVVLATRGREVRLASGTSVLIQLTTPLTVRVAN